MKKNSVCLLLAVIALTTLGCGPGGSEISGKVTVDGQPAPRGTVNLNGATGSFRGAIGADGTYTIENVLSGTYDVAIAGVLDKEPASSMGEDMYNQSGPPPKSLIDAKYASPTESGLKVTVPDGDYDFALEKAN